jgi:hypothetical protein
MRRHGAASGPAAGSFWSLLGLDYTPRSPRSEPRRADRGGLPEAADALRSRQFVEALRRARKPLPVIAARSRGDHRSGGTGHDRFSQMTIDRARQTLPALFFTMLHCWCSA